MSFDEIFDLTAGVYFNFYNIIFSYIYRMRIHPKSYTFFTTFPYDFEPLSGRRAGQARSK